MSAFDKHISNSYDHQKLSHSHLFNFQTADTRLAKDRPWRLQTQEAKTLNPAENARGD